jgi:hypothetical protein
MEVQGREGYLLYMDEIDPSVTKGTVLKNARTDDEVVIMYIDREENVLGFLPIGEFR